jgi:thiol-disulfide isomerase/thioredoxin
MAAFVLAKEPIPLPEIKFTGEDGKPLSLDAFKGKVVLLNLWATWCAPCRKEMPDLDRLQGALGSEKFLVVAISIDRTGVNGAKAFLDKVGVKRLEAYADETMRSSSALRVVGMPTTLLLDLDGREVGRLTGPAKWDGADAKALIGSMVVRLHRTASSTQR